MMMQFSTVNVVAIQKNSMVRGLSNSVRYILYPKNNQKITKQSFKKELGNIVFRKSVFLGVSITLVQWTI